MKIDVPSRIYADIYSLKFPIDSVPHNILKLWWNENYLPLVVLKDPLLEKTIFSTRKQISWTGFFGELTLEEKAVEYFERNVSIQITPQKRQNLKM